MAKSRVQQWDSRTAPSRHVAFYLLTATVMIGSLAIAPGTRSMTDVKGPVFIAGTLLLALLLGWEFAFRPSLLVPAGLPRFVGVCFAYLALVAASALWASHTWIVKYIFAEHGLHLLLAVIAVIIISEIGFWRGFLVAYVVTGAAVALSSLYIHAAMPYFYRYPGTHIEALGNLFMHGLLHGFAAQRNGAWVRLDSLNDMHAPLGNANLLAGFLLIPIGTSIAFLWREWKGAKRDWVFTALGGTLLVTLTVFGLCRPVSYGMGLALLITVFLSLRTRLWYVFVPLLGLAAIAAFGVLRYCPTSQNESGRTVNCVEYFMHTKSYLVRSELWRRAWVMTLEKPVLGWGAGNYFTDSDPVAAQVGKERVVYYEGGGRHEDYRPKVLASADSNAHNEYLQQSAEFGIVGLAVYLGILGVVIKAAFDARRAGFQEQILLDGVISVFIAFLFTNIMNPEVHFADFARHFWLVAALLVAARGMQEGRKVFVPSEVRSLIAVVVTALCAYGAWQFVYVDYGAARDFWSAYDPSSEMRALPERQEALEAAKLYSESADRTWDKVLRIRGLWGAGVNFQAAGEPDRAISELKTLSDEVIALSDTDYRLGYVYERIGDYDRALAHYEIDAAGHPEEGDRSARRILIVKALLEARNEGRTPTAAPGASMPEDQ